MKKQVQSFLKALFVIAGLFSAPIMRSQVGAAMSFDGINDYMSAPVICPTTNFTNEFWFRTTVGTQGIFSARDANLGGSFDRELVLIGGNIRAYIWQNTTSELITTTGTNFADGQWHHVAHVVGAAVGGQRIYVDGVLRAQGVASFSAFNWNTVINVGNAAGQSPGFFNGQIDELRCWNVVRTQCEINTYKNCEIPSSFTGLMANYHFNNGVAGGNNAGLTAVFDFSGFNRTGTLINLGLNGPISNWIAPGPFTSGFTTPLAAPAVSVTANPALSVCSGNTVSLSGTGANTYTWTGGITNGTAFTPTAMISNYTVTGTNTITTCTNSAVASVSVSTCSGTVASALNFDGANDYVQVTTATGLPLGNNPRTLEAWIKTTNTAASTVIFNYGTPTNNNRCGMLVEGGTGRLYFVGEFNDLQGTPTATVADGNWHHVAVVYTGGATGTLSLYVDGKFNTSAVKNLNTTGNTLRIGQRAFPQTGEFFNGSIDEVRIWNVARTQCQLNTYMNCEIPTTATGLVANYHFNHGFAAAANPTVTTLVDASGSNNNGTLNSFALNGATSNWIAPSGVANGFTTPLAAPAVSVTANPALSICSGNTVSLSGAGANTYAWTGGITDGTAFTPTALINNYTVTGTNTITTCTNSAVASVSVSACSGTVASALNFNNASVPDNVLLPTAIATSSLIGGNKITVEAWVRPTSLANLGCVVGNYATPNPNMQFLLRRDNNFYTFWVGNSATNSWTGVFSTAGTATLNTWHHVAGVYNGTVLSIYINGVLSSTATANYTFAPTTNSLLIGGNNISENFNGDIDEVRIWNTARTQCDINTYKNCEIPTNATGLVANYHFNQGFAAAANPTVTTLTDATSNAFNGTLNTFALNGATSNWVAPSGVANGFTTALAAPSISVAANPALGVCSGSSLSLTGSGVNTYTWTGGITNGTAFTPTASANYTVNGTNSITTCTATAVANVTVNAIPTVSVNSGAICSGNSFTMAPTGAATYSYSSGSAVVTPTATAAYTVTGSSAQGCNASAISNVTVNPLPSVNATSSSSLICVGQSATLTATGATTYSWSTGGATATEVITPTVTTSYTVTGVDANSCVNSAVLTQSVSACTGVNELGNAFNAVRLYPNPTSSDITLELPENANVVIYNSLGQVIFNQNLTYGNNVINLDALAKGIYVVQISNAANKANYRVVKH